MNSKELLLIVYKEIMEKFEINKVDAATMLEAYRMETISEVPWECFGYKNRFEKSKVAAPVEDYMRWPPNVAKLVRLAGLGDDIVLHIDESINWKAEMCQIIRKKTYLK